MKMNNYICRFRVRNKITQETQSVLIWSIRYSLSLSLDEKIPLWILIIFIILCKIFVKCFLLFLFLDNEHKRHSVIESSPRKDQRSKRGESPRSRGHSSNLKQPSRPRRSDSFERSRVQENSLGSRGNRERNRRSRSPNPRERSRSPNPRKRRTADVGKGKHRTMRRSRSSSSDTDGASHRRPQRPKSRSTERGESPRRRSDSRERNNYSSRQRRSNSRERRRSRSRDRRRRSNSWEENLTLPYWEIGRKFEQNWNQIDVFVISW